MLKWNLNFINRTDCGIRFISMVELNKREQKILMLIIDEFVEIALPVSSSSLCKRHDLGFSSATVRNVMVDLENKGLIFQPHVSAGRIPTDSGYRIYVDSLMSVGKLSPSERRNVLRKLKKVSNDVNQILEKASKILSEISNQLGIVLLPRYYEGIFRKLELVPISTCRTLLVIQIKSGLVKTIMLELDFEISREILEATSSVLNERLHGLRLSEIKKSINNRLKNVSIGHTSLIDYFRSSVEELFDFDNWEDYYFGGARNILRQPEFTRVSKFDNLMEILENKPNMIQFLDGLSDKQPIKISIGKEISEKKLSSFSVVTSNYQIGNVRGIIGIIGPTRMDYSRMVSIVNYMSQAISNTASN